MVKTKDLNILQKVIIFDHSYKKIYEGIIKSVNINSLLSGKEYEDYADVALINPANKEKFLSDTVRIKGSFFKDASGYSNFYSWCFPECKRYIKHYEDLWSGKLKIKKPTPEDYKKLPHDNNAKQKEEKLKRQRECLYKIMSAKSIFYKYTDTKYDVIKNPGQDLDRFKFDEDTNTYLFLGRSGYTKVTKLGTTILIREE